MIGRSGGRIAKAGDRINGLSVVIPVYNERDNLAQMYRELSTALIHIGRPYEIIFVDDGSIDGSGDILARLAREDEHLRVVVFRRNYGQTAAMQAGIDQARMDAIVTIDGDLQNDPADIGRMVAKLEEGHDLVHGWRRDRRDAFFSRKIPSHIANRLISSVTHFPIHDLGCTLKIMRRSILSEIELYGDMHRFIPLLLYQRGARCAEVVTNHRERVSGVTKYGIGRTLTVLLDLVTVKFLLDYAAHPMRIFGGLGLICFALSITCFLLTAAMKLLDGVDMTGNPILLMASVAGLAGLQLVSLGIIGEISARIYYGRGPRTHFAIQEILNGEPARPDDDGAGG